MRLSLLLPIHAAVWVANRLVVAPLWLLGFPLLYVLARLHAWETRRSRFYAYEDGSPRLLAQWRHRWVWLVYGNDEDGIAGPRSFMQGEPVWRRVFVWSAWRNPTNNLRFVFPFGIRIRADRVRVLGNVIDSPIDDERGDLAWIRSVAGDEADAAALRWSYCYQGAFAGVWIRRPGRYPRIRKPGGWRTLRIRREFAVLNFRCGYKILPRDARGVPAYDYRAPGAGFGFQCQLREVGK